MSRNPLDNPQVRAAHLLRRAGFGGTPVEIAAYAALNYKDAVEKLLTFKYDGNLAFNLERKLQDADYSATLQDLGYWWLLTMLRTRQPLQEKMTLFWHGHFTTSYTKVNRPVSLLTQNQLYRDNALGNFRELVKKVSRDPAMIEYLDGQSNRKGKPNENYARELMELFTIGIGNYTEQDVREAARTFTGWGYRGRSYFYDPKQHDADNKTFMGKSGNFNGDDIIDIILDRKETAQHIASKLWSYFAYPNPEPALVTRLSETFYNSKYDIKELMRTIFNAPEFLAEKAYRALVKSPTEYIVGTFRQIGTTGIEAQAVRATATMGQTLFAPPSVKGWDGQLAWISSTYFFERINAANGLVSSRGNQFNFDLYGTMQDKNLDSGEKVIDYYLNTLLDGQFQPALKSALLDYTNDSGALNIADLKAGNGNPKSKAVDTKLRGSVHLILSSPDYMLK
jgi:uncharacterized protein (DUF1800 family)